MKKYNIVADFDGSGKPIAWIEESLSGSVCLVSEVDPVVSHLERRLDQLGAKVRLLDRVNAELVALNEGSVADRLFVTHPAERELRDRLDELFGEEFVDEVTWDSYDRSVEVYVSHEALLPEHYQKQIMELGFTQAWVHRHLFNECPRRSHSSCDADHFSRWSLAKVQVDPKDKY